MSYKDYSENWQMRYPAIADLEKKARRRIPDVAWAYLQSGTGTEELTRRNISDIQKIELTPRFLKGQFSPDITTSLFGKTYDAPFGIAPVGLTGLMWPRCEIYLADSAKRFGIPYCLSTVATETPESVGKYVGDRGWFQLYPPRGEALRRTLLERAASNGFHTLVITADVPMPSRRERTKKAGVQIPPKINLRLLWDAVKNPSWTMATLSRGLPRLRTIESYAEFRTMASVGAYVQNQFGGNLSWSYCEALRKEWSGPLVLKGILHPEDAKRAVDTGFDGIVVSNHGGRQFDAAPSAISVLPGIVEAVGKQTAVLFDSGIRSGLDILRALAYGADFVLCGRAFMYGVCALGRYGGDHVAHLLKEDLVNNMVQLGTDSLETLRMMKVS